MNSQIQFEDLWSTIDSLEKKGLFAEAKYATHELIRKAIEEKASNHALKGIIYSNRFTTRFEENGLDKNISFTQDQQEYFTGCYQNVLNSLLADLHWKYLLENHWKMDQNIYAAKSDSSDVSAMSVNEMMQRINEQFLRSLTADCKMLPSDRLEIILDKGERPELTPTVFDLLAYNALKFWNTDMFFSNMNTSNYILDSDHDFAEAGVFTRNNYPQENFDDHRLNALKTYQQLLSLHLERKDTIALVYADLQRLDFVRQYSELTTKDSLYRHALENLLKGYQGHPASLQIAVSLAQWWMQQNEVDSNFVIARDICLEVLAGFPDTFYSATCENLIQEIERKEIDIAIEQVNLPNKDILYKIGHRNSSRIYFHLFAVDQKFLDRIHQSRTSDKYILFANKKALRTWDIQPVGQGFYKKSSFEEGLEQLPLGSYILIASAGKDFKAEHARSFNIFHVSRLANAVLPNQDFRSIIISDRASGQPLSDVIVKIYEWSYGRETSKKFISEERSNEAGIVSFQKGFKGSIGIDLLYGNDTLNLGENVYISGNRSNPLEIKQTLLFTDRAIYQPGQTIYFKALLYRSASEELPVIQTKTSFSVGLYDTNGELISKRELTSNDFGSASGMLQLPSGLLNGTFSLRSTFGQISIPVKVENYKRPTFDIEFQKPDLSVKIGDQIPISGQVKTFNDIPISRAEVRYTIKRNPNYFYRYGIWPPYPGQEVELEAGKVTTDANGRFSFEFLALGDKKQTWFDRFSFEIGVAVTDQNGETQRDSEILTITSKSVQYNIEVAEDMPIEKLSSLRISSRNAFGKPLSLKGVITIDLLNTTKHFFRERYWERIPADSNSELADQFPDYDFSGEDELNNIPVKKRIYELKIDTFDFAEVSIPAKEISKGYFRATFISSENEKVVQQFRITEDGIFEEYSSNNLFSIATLPDQYQAGDSVELAISKFSAAPIFVIEQKKNNTRSYWTAEQNLSFQVNEDDKGGFSIFLLSFYNNRYQHQNFNINVPYLEKELRIEVEPFDSVVLPGSDQEISLQLIDWEGNGIQGEVLISLYDAALDEIYSRKWPGIGFPTNYQYLWVQVRGYQQAYQDLMYSPIEWKQEKGQSMDRIMEIQSFDNRRMMRFKGEVELMEAAPMQSDVVGTLDQEIANEVAGEEPDQQGGQINIREKLEETVFFFAHVETDSTGKASIHFTNNESLSEWKMRFFGHDKELAYATKELKIQTRQDLMLFPNLPRALRNSDEANLQVKLVNQSTEFQVGKLYFNILSLHSEKQNELFQLTPDTQVFEIAAGGQQIFNWLIQVPKGWNVPVRYQFIAQAEHISDAIQGIFPILSNQIQLVDSWIIDVNGQTDTSFSLDNIPKDIESMTLEITANPAWYGIQAIPYLLDYPYESTDHLVNLYYCNMLARDFMNRHPAIRQLILSGIQSGSLTTPLWENDELKNILLSESPWIAEAKTEQEILQRLAIFAHPNQVDQLINNTVYKLKSRQLGNGALPWFKDGHPNLWVTNYTINQMAEMKQSFNFNPLEDFGEFLVKAIEFADAEFKDKYHHWINNRNDDIPESMLSYLLARQVWKDIEIKKDLETIFMEIINNTKTNWSQRPASSLALLGQIAKLNGDLTWEKEIMAALKDQKIHNDKGIYWKQANSSELETLENQADIMFFFQAVEDYDLIPEMQKFLLSHKRTNMWNTSRATTKAVKALFLNQSADQSLYLKPVQCQIGSFQLPNEDVKQLSASGYYKVTWSEGNLPVTEEIFLQNPNHQPAWGAVYVKHLKSLSEVDQASNVKGFQVEKTYLKKSVIKGKTYTEEITSNTELQIGDVVVCQMRIQTDRPMEFVHLKDYRPSCLEAGNVLSGYKWENGLYYYQDHKDVASNYFIDYLLPGSYIIESSYTIFHTGDFEAGPAVLQSFYAPEFSSRTSGKRFIVQQSN